MCQEYKADNAIELLKQKLALNARVLRAGKWTEVPARELVPGDIVRVRLGDIIPADIKLTDGDYLQVDESALTGESLPVEKHLSDVAYSLRCPAGRNECAGCCHRDEQLFR